jgi:hypothetical protein
VISRDTVDLTSRTSPTQSVKVVDNGVLDYSLAMLSLGSNARPCVISADP